MEELVTVERAEGLAAEALSAAAAEDVSLLQAHGRILVDPIRAERDQPPFHRVTMDGMAFHYGAIAGETRAFRVAGIQRAGQPSLSLPDPGLCLEVMTGAVLPEGCDCVVPIEDIVVSEGVASLKEGISPVAMQHIHPRGSDYRMGEVLLEPGTRLRAPEIAVAASAGLATVRVARIPALGVVTTGDELVDVGVAVAPHQIRRSNDHALASGLRLRGFNRIETRHVPDDPDRLTSALAEMLDRNEVVLITGGVSMGRFDYVPRVLHALDVKVLFHKVKQRPGKPLLFGVGARGQAVFALPGNPVSALVCFYRYVLPWLSRSLGEKPRPREMAALDRPLTFKPDLTWFLPVRLRSDDGGRQWAEPCLTNTSGDFAGLAGTDGFIELEAHVQEFPEGYAAPVYRWDV